MENEMDWAQGWTAWRVWLHPREARDVIDESVIRIMELDKSITTALETCAGSEASCRDMQAELESLRGRLETREKELEERGRELAATKEALAAAGARMEEMRDELELQRSVDEKLEEFRLQLAKVEEMKQRYELRIKELEEALEKSRGEIAFKTPGIEPETPKENHADLLRRRYQEKRAPGLPDDKDDGRDADDWLLNLPSDLV